MAIYVTKIEKYKFACGLFWQSLSRPRELKKEAVDLAKKIESDLMIIRMDHSTAQAGFAQRVDVGPGTVYSLAAVVSKTLSLEGAYYDGLQQPVHNWLAAFRLPDGKWSYIAVRDANFLPNGDFAGTKEEVMDRLQADYSLGGWNVVIGNEELSDYGFHNFNARTIESMIPQRKDGSIKMHRWWGLKEVTPKYRGFVYAGIAVLVIIGCMYGYTAWQKHQKAEAQRQQDEAMEAMRQQLLRENSLANRPWAKMSPAQEAIGVCAGNLRWLTAGGWLLDSYSCTPDKLVYAWVRNNSNISYLREVVPNADIEMAGDKAILAVAAPPAKGRNENLLPISDVLIPLEAKMQSMGLKFTVAQRKTVPQPGAAPSVLPPTWNAYVFLLAGNGLTPAEIGAVLDRPGLRIEKMNYVKQNWLVEGVIYAK